MSPLALAKMDGREGVSRCLDPHEIDSVSKKMIDLFDFDQPKNGKWPLIILRIDNNFFEIIIDVRRWEDAFYYFFVFYFLSLIFNRFRLIFLLEF